MVTELSVVTVHTSRSESQKEAVSSGKGFAGLNLRGMEEEGRTLPKEYMLDKIGGGA